MSIQEALKLLRLELGISQESLAKKLNKTFITVNRWENGKAFPSRANSLKILDIATKEGASGNCLAYLNEVLIPEQKRSHSGNTYGFPEVDKEFLFQLADNSENGMYVIDAETYEIIYVNRTAEKTACRDLRENGDMITDRRLAVLKNKACYYFFGKRSEPCAFCPLKQMKDTDFVEKVITIPEIGRRYNVRAKSSTMNNRRIFIIYLTDISALMKEREALYNMANDIPDGVGIYNVYYDWRVELIFINKVFYQWISKMRQGELMDFAPTDDSLLAPGDKERIFAETKAAILEKRDVSITIQMKIIDGTYHKLHLTGKMLGRDHEKFTYYSIFTQVN